MGCLHNEMQRPPLHLYRALIRAARQMPEEYKRSWVLTRTRMGFEEMRGEEDQQKVFEALMVGEAHLDTVLTQVEHLGSIISNVQDEQKRHERDRIEPRSRARPP